MFVLPLRYTLLFIASINFANGFNKIDYNITNEIESLASYLKEHDLTIVDSDNKRIFFFIVNKYGNLSVHYRRSEDANAKIEMQVGKKLDFIMNTAVSTGTYAGPVSDGLKMKDKIAYIDDFMKSHLQSTDYLYEELQRIKRKHIAKDSLRKMISFLEIPEYRWMKKKVSRCFIEARKKAWHSHTVYWNQDTNDLAFNIVGP